MISIFLCTYVKNLISNAEIMNSFTILPKKILLLSDDQLTAYNLTSYIKEEDFNITHSNLLQTNNVISNNGIPDLIIVDIISRKLDALDVCLDIRNAYKGPLLLLSNRIDNTFYILGLEYGCDDILQKPVDLPLIVAKIRALLRRVHLESKTSLDIIEVGSFKIDTCRREVYFNKNFINVTSVEFALLWQLVANAGKILSRNDIHKALYNCEYNGYDRSIDIYIARIRTKLGEDHKNPQFIKTIRGEGYLFLPKS